MAGENFQAPEPVRLTREQAQDARTYRLARERAASLGVELIIAPYDESANPWGVPRPAASDAALAAAGPGPRTIDGRKMFVAPRSWLAIPSNYRIAKESACEILVLDD